MSKKNISYQEAMNELEEILQAMEGNELSIDMLTEKAKRAAELIIICKDKLKGTEAEIKKINNLLSE